MSLPWRDVAIYGTAAAVGVLSAGSLPAGEAANCLKLLLDGRAPNFRSLVAKAEKALGQHIAQDHRGEAGFAPIRAAVEQMLRDHGWSPALAVEADLDPDRIAKRIVDAGQGLLVFEPHERQEPGAAAVRERRRLAEALIACVYRAILADGRQLNEVLPEALSALLKLRADVARLPDTTAEALLDLQTRLLLTPGTRVLTERQPQDSWLLRPDYAVVPFDPARQADLDELLAWCGDGCPRAVRLLHGPGGFGKSRLLIEATRILRGQGWHAGFLARGDTIPPAGTYERLCAGERPVLITIDYAETRREEVVRVLRRVRAGTAPALRVVLLARAAGDWWPELKRADQDVQELLDAYAGERALPPVADDQATRRRAFEMAAAAFAARLGLDGAPPAAPDLTEKDYGRFLFVHLAALAAVRGELPERADRLLAWVLDRERRAWRLGLEDEGLLPVRQHEALAAQGAALATLAGSIRGEPELEALLATVPLARSVEPLRLRALGSLLARLYPDASGLGALRPDLLGEELVAGELTRDPRLHEAAFGPDVPDEWLEGGLTVLARLARREPEHAPHLQAALRGRVERLTPSAVRVAIETGGPIGTALATTVAAEPPADPRPLERLLPNRTVSLREFRVVVALQLREQLRAAASSGGEPELAALARINNNLGVYLGEFNRRPEALDATEEATATYRRLAEANPDAFLPDLARSLSNLGVWLSQLNRRPEALDAEEEAIAIYRHLAGANPDAFLADLAISLSNLGIRLSQLNRRPEALAATEEAAATYRRLAQANPDAFLPDLAMSLSNLAIWLSQLNRRPEALEAAEEATAAYCRLAAAKPDAFLPGLATSLSNLGIQLRQLNRGPEALAATEEAVAICHRLAETNPDAFLPDLATSLSILADRLEEGEQIEEALARDRDAILALAPFARRLPEAFGVELAEYVRDYRRRCERAGVEVDAALVAQAALPER